MASLKPSHFLSVVAFAIFLLSHQVHSDEEDNLLQGLNDYRTHGNIPGFTKNKNAHCAAKKIADDLDDSDTPCAQGNETRLSDYPKAISKCNIDPNTTSDVVVLPVCVPDLIPTLVLTNFTSTHFSKYINDSSFTGIGLSTEDDWMVAVLAKDTPSGSLGNGAYSLVNAKVGLGHYLVLLLLGLVLCVGQ